MSNLIKILGRTEKIQKRRIEILRDLQDDEWLTPMKIGGTDGSRHSNDLKALIKMGYVTKRHHGFNGRGSCTYRRTSAGKGMVKSIMSSMTPSPR